MFGQTSRNTAFLHGLFSTFLAGISFFFWHWKCLHSTWGVRWKLNRTPLSHMHRLLCLYPSSPKVCWILHDLEGRNFWDKEIKREIYKPPAMLKTEAGFNPQFSWAARAHSMYCRRAEAAFSWVVGLNMLYLYHDVLQLMWCNVVRTQLPSSMQNKMERGWIWTEQASLSILLYHFTLVQIITFCSCSTWAGRICILIFEPWTVLNNQVTYPCSLHCGAKALPGDPANLPAAYTWAAAQLHAGK